MIGRWILAVAIAACAAGLCGCVERELTISSEPSGALVVLNGVEKGRTPLTTSFLWYGDYDVILRRAGYATLTTHASINAPWHEVPPLDLLSELAPWRYQDRRYLHFQLEPYSPPTEGELLRRAEEMRRRTEQEPPE